MNDTIQLLKNHHSVRDFADRPLPQETVNELIACAQAAATSHFVQAYSIIGVTNPEQKQAVAAISGQKHALANGHLFIFVADLNRHAGLMDDTAELGTTENLLVATIDATLAAQNLTIAAESLGLGCCYLGSLRNESTTLIEVLGLPEYTFPLFGIACGYPENDHASAKPRLPLPEVYQENRYDTTTRSSQLTQYNQIIHQYYQDRGANARQDDWTTQMQRYFSTTRRHDVDSALKDQGFLSQ